MELLRKYFSVKAEDGNRPFDVPVTEDATYMEGAQAKEKLFDQVQYCMESDPETYLGEDKAHFDKIKSNLDAKH